MDTPHVLNKPMTVGKCQLKHRVVLPPLTRFRADKNHVPHDFVADYYSQRGSVPGTLLITEGTFISPKAGGYDNVPGIYNDEQIKGWKKVTDAVHAKGSYIYVQLWALGRVAVSSILAKDGYDVHAPSAIRMNARGFTGSESTLPREMTEEEIQDYLAQFAHAAKCAVAAGFDGVEVHGANGYLIDQFTQSVSNQRTDKWGGSYENRARFGLEVTKACVDAIGADRVAYRVSPWGTFQEMGMESEDIISQFEYLVQKLTEMNLSYIHGVESRVNGPLDAERPDYKSLDFLADLVQKVNPEVAFISSGGHTIETASKIVAERPNQKVATGHGRYFISNPDLPFRIFNNIAQTEWDRNVFYVPEDPKGYSDYTFCEEFKAAAGKL
ncbi:NADPH dehydrogenase [Ascosphaera apis ARSEF 7405]|uniref:NADPH dehydrogenase n=1 Tax=Ascosphaera apis ARSEF 7405 TaxID=392613 RepID=A0A167VD48_9EURO|nr:NADPH dehydrogenase [Ascosphaera apis ARSEF 7405]